MAGTTHTSKLLTQRPLELYTLTSMIYSLNSSIILSKIMVHYQVKALHRYIFITTPRLTRSCGIDISEALAVPTAVNQLDTTA